MITLSWLSGPWRLLLYSLSVCSCHLIFFFFLIYLFFYLKDNCHLFLISSSSVGFLPFLFFIVPIFAWNVPLVSLILLNRSLVFPILLFSSISLHFFLKTFLSLLGTLHLDGFIFPLIFFASHFSYFLSCLVGLLTQPFALLALFVGDGFDHCLLYDIMSLHPFFFWPLVYQIWSLESICHFNCIIIRDLIILINVKTCWYNGKSISGFMCKMLFISTTNKILLRSIKVKQYFLNMLKNTKLAAVARSSRYCFCSPPLHPPPPLS